MEEKIIRDLIRNRERYCSNQNFIGIGSTRKVYRFMDYVVKLHLHQLGYRQSKNEMEIYNSMVERGLADLFAETYYTDESIAIQKYNKPIEMRDNQSFEIDLEQEAHLLPDRYEEVLHILDKEFDCFDLRDSSNYGLNEQGKLTFIDYGMTKTLYEQEWVPAAESGILPQIFFDFCNTCGVKRELRMYGDNDHDRRCLSCGKE